nr:angio associated migratory cell protein [Hymenolepis microstoma]
MIPYNSPSHNSDDEVGEVYLPDDVPVEYAEVPSDEDVEMMSDSRGSEVFTPETDDAKLVLAKHRDSVFCVDVHPTGKLIASGSQDDNAIVWNLETGIEIFICTGHSDSVTYVAFSPDGQFLATGDMAGCTQIWHLAFPSNSVQDTIITLNRSLQFGELSSLSWWQLPSQASHGNRPRPLVLNIGSEDGIYSANLVGISSRIAEKAPKYLMGSGKAVVGVVAVPSTNATERPLFAVICRDGDFRVWDIKDERILLQSSLLMPPFDPDVDVTEEELSKGYLCIDAPHESQIVDMVAVGGFEKVVLVPCRPPPFEEVENGPKKINANSLTTIQLDAGSMSVETVEFSPTHPFLAFGTVGGQIGVYDTSLMRMRQRWSYTDPSTGYEEAFGITSLKWSRSEPLVFYTSTLAGSVVAWNASSGNGTSVAVWRGHSAAVLDLALAPVTPEFPRERFIVSSSDDHSVRVFDTERLRENTAESA